MDNLEKALTTASSVGLLLEFRCILIFEKIHSMKISNDKNIL